MDLDKAKKTYPDYVKACGYEFSGGKRSIQIWPPTNVAWIASFTGKNPYVLKACIEKLLTPQMEMVDGEAIYYKNDGLKARPQYEGAKSIFTGNIKGQQCGWKAANNIVSGPGNVNGIQYLVHWEGDLEHLGYRTNLSMQVMPYDWRLDPKYIVKTFKFKAAIEHLFALTGKKIMVATHSYGINTGYEGMLQFNAQERQKYFSGFVSIGGPWLGAGDPLSYLAGMSVAEFGIFGKLKLDGAFGNLPVLYTLTPKDTYERFAKEDWVKKTLQLEEYYKHKSDTKPFDFMPERKELCTVDEFNKAQSRSDFTSQCTTDIVDYQILAKVGDKTWKISEAQEFLKKYGTGDRAEEYYKAFNTHEESAFENINIPAYIFISNFLSTPYYNEYEEPKKEGDRLPQPKKKIPMAGDGTVPLISQLGPGFKWATEFEAKKPNTKPVKIIHYCNSLHKRSLKKYSELYSDEDWVKELDSETKNSYLDLDCTCAYDKIVNFAEDHSDQILAICGHYGAFIDLPVRNFVMHLMMKGEKTNGLTDFVKSIDERYLEDVDKACTVEKPAF